MKKGFFAWISAIYLQIFLLSSVNAEVVPQTIVVSVVEGGSNRPVQARVIWSNGTERKIQNTLPDGKLKLSFTNCAGALTIKAIPLSTLLNGREQTVGCAAPTIQFVLAKSQLASIFDAAIMESGSLARNGTAELRLTEAINVGDFAIAAKLSNDLAAKYLLLGKPMSERLFSALAMEYGFRAAGSESPAAVETGLIRFDPAQNRVVTSKLGKSFLKEKNISATGKWDSSAFKAVAKLQDQLDK